MILNKKVLQIVKAKLALGSIPSLSENKRGMYLPVILMCSVVFIALAMSIVSIAMVNMKMSELHNKKITAMSIAEAGINYYMWHMAHDNTDYCDGQACNGTGTYGPYTHQYTNSNNEVIGTYDLFITPPTPGDSNVIVKSVGKVSGISPVKTIVSEIGMPSFSKYTLLIDQNQLHLGTGGKIEGSVHVNYQTINNEGEITGDVSSTEENGVYGSGIFRGAKLFPVPPIDFNRLDVDILKIRNDARNNGNGDWYNISGDDGYQIILNPTSYDLYRVNNHNNTGFNISNKTFLGNHNYPAEGVIICEDNVWVEGTIDNTKVTIIAADPESNGNNTKNLYITNRIKYNNFDGSDKIGLISQTSIFLAQNVPSNMEIDAAMIAKNGFIKINNYAVAKDSLKLYGSMAAKNVTWKYTSGVTTVSGFKERDMIADQQNILNPPPKFPLTGTYAILSWREE